MKIKMIDLLVTIAKGEEIPKMIKYKSKTYSYDELERDYKNYTSTNDWLFESYLITNILNDEIEILDEPKKIEKINRNRYPGTDIDPLDDILDKIDELIDEINNLKENK